MLFSVHADGNLCAQSAIFQVNKPEAIFRPPGTEKKSMCMLFSILADGNLCAQSAIFLP